MVIWRAFDKIPRNEVVRVWVADEKDNEGINGQWVHAVFLGWNKYTEMAEFLLVEGSFMNQKIEKYIGNVGDVYGADWRYSEEEEKRVFQLLEKELQEYKDRLKIRRA